MPEERGERAKAIEAALSQIDKQFGKGSMALARSPLSSGISPPRILA